MIERIGAILFIIFIIGFAIFKFDEMMEANAKDRLENPPPTFSQKCIRLEEIPGRNFKTYCKITIGKNSFCRWGRVRDSVGALCDAFNELESKK